jgi:hypothetical protein
MVVWPVQVSPFSGIQRPWIQQFLFWMSLRVQLPAQSATKGSNLPPDLGLLRAKACPELAKERPRSDILSIAAVDLLGVAIDL